MAKGETRLMEDLTDNGSTENINKGDLENASGPTGENEETPETTESKAKTVADEDMESMMDLYEESFKRFEIIAPNPKRTKNKYHLYG